MLWQILIDLFIHNGQKEQTFGWMTYKVVLLRECVMVATIDASERGLLSFASCPASQKDF